MDCGIVPGRAKELPMGVYALKIQTMGARLHGPRPEIGSGLCCESCPQSRKFLVARTLHGVEALATLNAY
jgi:hypothetical protein